MLIWSFCFQVCVFFLALFFVEICKLSARFCMKSRCFIFFANSLVRYIILNGVNSHIYRQCVISICKNCGRSVILFLEGNACLSSLGLLYNFYVTGLMANWPCGLLHKINSYLVFDMFSACQVWSNYWLLLITLSRRQRYANLNGFRATRRYCNCIASSAIAVRCLSSVSRLSSVCRNASVLWQNG